MDYVLDNREMRVHVHPGCSQSCLPTVRLKDRFRFMDDKERETKLHLDEALLAGEWLRDDGDCASGGTENPTTLRVFARLIRQSFGNET